MKPLKANKLMWLTPVICGSIVFVFQNCSGFSPETAVTSSASQSVGGGGTTTTTTPPTVTSTASSTPLQFTVQIMSESQVNVSWASGGTQSGYLIERALSNGGPFTVATGPGTFSQIASVDGNTLTYADKGLMASTQYYYRMRASASDGTASAYTSTLTVTTPAKPASVPTAPSNLLATAAAATLVNLTWVDNSSNESYFSIERSTDNGLTFTVVAAASENATSFQDINLLAATTYVYRIRAVNSAGDSTYAANATVTTLAAGNTATFSYVETNIITPNCVGCHAPGIASGGYDFSTYAAVSKSISAGNANGSTLYTVIKGGTMPPGGGITALQLSQIAAWINAGGANN